MWIKKMRKRNCLPTYFIQHQQIFSSFFNQKILFVIKQWFRICKKLFPTPIKPKPRVVASWWSFLPLPFPFPHLLPKKRTKLKRRHKKSEKTVLRIVIVKLHIKKQERKRKCFKKNFSLHLSHPLSKWANCLKNI